jgi:hypothetical protein
MDVATELNAAAADDSLPALGLDRVWIRHDGHAVLLDFPAPGAGHRSTGRAGVADHAPAGLLGGLRNAASVAGMRL